VSHVNNKSTPLNQDRLSYLFAELPPPPRSRAAHPHFDAGFQKSTLPNFPANTRVEKKLVHAKCVRKYSPRFCSKHSRGAECRAVDGTAGSMAQSGTISRGMMNV